MLVLLEMYDGHFNVLGNKLNDELTFFLSCCILFQRVFVLPCLFAIAVDDSCAKYILFKNVETLEANEDDFILGVLYLQLGGAVRTLKVEVRL